MDKKPLVYALLRQVPRGKVTTYKALARTAGTHPRAVAAFMKANKDPAGIPCYRVVKADGRLGGYSAPGGVPAKEALLRKDGVPVTGGSVDMSRFLHRFGPTARG
jgi:methylated-DNA-[protein]-cysteine S-methyltransferase